MSVLAQHWPRLAGQTQRLPLTRDQLMLLMVAINLIFLGIDTWLAHNESGTIVPRESIPVYFGFAAGVVMLAAGLLAVANRTLASILATLTLLASVGVGVLGAWFHLMRAALPYAPVGERISLNLLVWAPPLLGPMAFAMVGVLGISAAWLEQPKESGRLHLFGNVWLGLPYSKTRAYFYIVGMGIIAALVSSVLDHARTGFLETSVWIATAVGIFGLVAAVSMGAINDPSRLDLYTYIFAMGLLILAGPLGLWFHIRADLATGNVIVIERFLRGAPLLAPLLYTNMGLIGLLALIDSPEV